MESFFNISLSYREDADVKNVYYGLVRRVKTPGENLADIIEKFGAENQHLGASKSSSSVLSVTFMTFSLNGKYNYKRLYFRSEILEWFS